MRATLTSGTPVIADDLGSPPHSIGVIPGSGCTVRVELSLGPKPTVWYAWDAGDVTAATVRVCRGPINSVRFTRTVGSGVDSVVEVV